MLPSLTAASNLLPLFLRAHAKLPWIAKPEIRCESRSPTRKVVECLVPLAPVSEGQALPARLAERGTLRMPGFRAGRLPIAAAPPRLRAWWALLVLEGLLPAVVSEMVAALGEQPLLIIDNPDYVEGRNEQGLLVLMVRTTFEVLPSATIPNLESVPPLAAAATFRVSDAEIDRRLEVLRSRAMSLVEGSNVENGDHVTLLACRGQGAGGRPSSESATSRHVLGKSKLPASFEAQLVGRGHGMPFEIDCSAELAELLRLKPRRRRLTIEVTEIWKPVRPSIDVLLRETDHSTIEDLRAAMRRQAEQDAAPFSQDRERAAWLDTLAARSPLDLPAFLVGSIGSGLMEALTQIAAKDDTLQMIDSPAVPSTQISSMVTQKLQQALVGSAIVKKAIRHEQDRRRDATRPAFVSMARNSFDARDTERATRLGLTQAAYRARYLSSLSARRLQEKRWEQDAQVDELIRSILDSSSSSGP